MPETEATSLKAGALGTRNLAVMIIATTVPLASVAALMPVAIGYGTGLGTPGAWLVVSVILVAFSIGWTRMSHYVTNAGAFYAYISRGLGRPLGLSGASTALLSYNAMAIGSLGIMAFFAHQSFNEVLSINLSWEVWAAIAYAALAMIAFRAVDIGARLLLAIVAVEFVVLGIVALAILFETGFGAFSFESFAPSNVFISGTGVTLAMAVTSAIGFEAAAVYGEEAREPRKSVPRATYLAIGLISVVYVLVCWALIAGAGGGEAAQGAAAENPGFFVFALAGQYVGKWLSDFMQIWVVVGTFGTVVACHNLATRYLYVLGRDRMLPSFLSRTRGVNHAPWHASVFQITLSIVVVAACAIGGVDPYIQLGTGLFAFAVVGIGSLMAVSSLAVARFFRTEQRGAIVPTLIVPLAAFCGLVYIVVAVLDNYGTLSGSTSGVLSILPWLLVIGAVVSFVYAHWLRGARPDRYSLLGELGVERVPPGRLSTAEEASPLAAMSNAPESAPGATMRVDRP